MIVKFHARGKGGGSDPVGYLLERERNRERATMLQGNPEKVWELIDVTPSAKKYMLDVLSFAERELPPGEHEKMMTSFKRILMPGLKRNQYSVLWVEHQDKGRLELSFVTPNMGLQTGKHLQPYYDRADRPRIDAWQALMNHHYGLHDPNAPKNHQTLTLPDNLPKTKQALAEGVTRGIGALYHAEKIKGRQDVIQALTGAGFEVVRVARNNISIADPNGGRNIKLRGAFYEQSSADGRGVREKAERESRIYRENTERRVQEARRTYKQGTDPKRIFNQERYQRPHNSPERTAGEVSENDRRYDGRALENRTENKRETLAVADYCLSTDVCHDRESVMVPGYKDKHEYEYSPRAEKESGETKREDMRHALSRGQQRAFSDVTEGDESRNELDEGRRQTEHSETDVGMTGRDGVGRTFTERIGATAAGLYAAAKRMGEHLRGIAEGVFVHATGQHGIERVSHAAESAGATLKRTDKTLEPVIQQEQKIRDERLMWEREHELSLEREHQPEIQEWTLGDPSLGWWNHEEWRIQWVKAG